MRGGSRQIARNQHRYSERCALRSFFSCGDMAPARPAANTSEQRKPGVSTRCRGRRKRVVKTRRKARPGANPFILPYRVRLPSICTPLLCAAGGCIRRKAASNVYDAGSRVKLGVPAFRVRHKLRHEHTNNGCADRGLCGMYAHP